MKKPLLLIGSLLLLLAIPAVAATVVGGQQVNRVWPSANLNGQLGLQILGAATDPGLSSSGVLTAGGKAVFESIVVFNKVNYTFPYGDGSATGKVLKTNGAGQLSWSADLTGGAGNFGSGNVLTLMQGNALLSSTGSIKKNFQGQFVASSTGALQTKFDGRYQVIGGYLATSTGALKTAFFPQLLVSSTGSLKMFFDANYFRSSTGSLKTYFNTFYQPLGGYLASSTGSLNVFFNTKYQPIGGYLATSTGSLKTLFDANYFRSSTGSLKTFFDANYFRTSTGALKATFFPQLLVSSTGSLKTLFDANYFRSSTGSLKTFFDANYFRTSTGALKATFFPQLLVSSTGSLKTFFDANYFRTSTGALKTAFFPQLLVSSTGSLKTFFDANYLRTSTGSLRASLYGFGQGLSRTIGGLVTLNQALTGSTLKESTKISDSGSLVVRGATNLSGSLTIFKPAGLGTGNLLVVDTIGLVYDGTNKRVGVGTSSPGQNFEIKGASPIMRFNDTTDNKQWDWGYDASNDYFYVDEFGTARQFKILNGGNAVFSQSVSVPTGAFYWMDGNGDGNWGMGRNTSSMTEAMVTGNAIEINAHDDSNGGFAVGKQGGNSYMELRGSDQQAYFRGSVGIKTTNASAALTVVGTMSGSKLVVSNMKPEGATLNAVCISATGAVMMNPAATCTISSKRFKHGIAPLTDHALQIIERMKPVSFLTNNTNERNIGFLAEDIEQLEPALVFYDPDGKAVRGVKYENITALLAKGIQELVALFTGLEKRIVALEQRVQSVPPEGIGHLTCWKTQTQQGYCSSIKPNDPCICK